MDANAYRTSYRRMVGPAPEIRVLPPDGPRDQVEEPGTLTRKSSFLRGRAARVVTT